MTLLVYLAIYAGVAVFVVASCVRAWHYARMPVHLRWELYPVPHQAPERARHGGSYFERANWWTAPPDRHRAGELRAMLQEMLFLRGLWEFNRPLWYRSFPFHLGLYLLFATALLLIVAAVLSLVAPSLSAGIAGQLMRESCSLSGVGGAAMTVGGALALLHRRLTHPDLRPYTVPSDILNLLFFIVALGALTLGWLARAEASPDALLLARGLLRFDRSLHLPASVVPGALLSAALVAYIPLTHMAHFIGKYFTYHAVRWDDGPAVNDPRLRRRIAEQLTYRPRWAAPHVGADGTRSWADVAAMNSHQDGKR